MSDNPRTSRRRASGQLHNEHGTVQKQVYWIDEKGFLLNPRQWERQSLQGRLIKESASSLIPSKGGRGPKWTRRSSLMQSGVQQGLSLISQSCSVQCPHRNAFVTKTRPSTIADLGLLSPLWRGVSFYENNNKIIQTHLHRLRRAEAEDLKARAIELQRREQLS